MDSRASPPVKAPPVATATSCPMAAPRSPSYCQGAAKWLRNSKGMLSAQVGLMVRGRNRGFDSDPLR